jgi:hypothetical protein
MFADVMKQARHWGNPNTPWDEAAPQDANSWPTGDAGAVFAVGVPGMGGTYRLSFTGNANVGIIASTDRPNTYVQNKIYNSGTNTTTADIVVSAAERNLMLSFTGQLGGVKDVKLIRPNAQPTDLFNPAFLARLRYFTTLRLMDPLATNGNPQVLWSDRTRPANASQAKGMSWEYAVMLANTTGKDLWINIPHRVLGSTYQLGETDYVTKVAQLFKYGSDGVNPYTGPYGSGTPNPVPLSGPIYPPLNPALHVYVEFSNELWNGIFSQDTWIVGLAQAALAARDPDLCYDGTTNLWTIVPRLMAKAIMQVSNGFRQAYGDGAMMTQIRPVLAAQIANAGTFGGLGYLDARYGGSFRYLYGVAGAPYIDIADERLPLTLDQTFAEMTTYQSGNLIPWITNLSAIARSHGIKMLAYEGGQTLYPSLGNSAVKLAAQTDQRMKSQMLNLFSNWTAGGGDIFMFYSLASAWNNSGYWGLAPDINYDTDTDIGYPTAERYPKWGAIKRIVTGQ